MKWPDLTEPQRERLNEIVEATAIECMAQMTRFVHRTQIKSEREAMLKDAAKLSVDCAVSLAFEMASRYTRNAE